MNRPPLFPALTLLLATAGCTMGPDYRRPETPVQTAWKETPGAATVDLEERWWKIFRDAELDRLETQAIGANQDLKRALARVEESRALAGLSEADRFPDVNGAAAYSRFRAGGKEPVSNQHRIGLDLSYELDLWGRVRRSSEAAQADAAASAADLQTALLVVTAEVARHYHQLRALDRELDILAATLALRADAVRLQESRHEAGLINEQDVSRARTEQANVEAELHAIRRVRTAIEHALAVLCGQPPGNFSIAANPVALTVPSIPVGLPSELLQRRPDLAAAEARLQAATARIGVAKAEFFPSIRLTGESGFASADLGSIGGSASRLWSAGPGFSLPVFDGGRNRANLGATEARHEQALAFYRGAILTAFREVEDSLSDLSALGAQAEAVARAHRSARDTAALAHERYHKGLSSYLEVVDAQRAALQAERQDAQLSGQRTTAVIQLAKALGGGWSTAVPQS